jgi:ribonuclease BN (tRNA processing enzyme)
MRLTFLGSGDAFGTGGRFNTCMLLETAERRRSLIDCGATSLVAMKRARVDPAAAMGRWLASLDEGKEAHSINPTSQTRTAG